MLRSTPWGRAGLLCGSSPRATRSVQSANYLNGALPSGQVSGFSMKFPACPDWTRRIQAASDDANSPRDAGMVRVESWPSWWQPTHARFFTTVSQSLWLMFAGMLLDPPNWLASGIFIIEYQ